MTSSKPSRKLISAYQTKLASSGLTRKDAEQLGFKLLAAADVSRLGPNFEERGGFLIPYWDDRGKQIKEMFRLRYLEAPAEGFKKAKPRRYMQPAGVRPHAYFPPFNLWRQLAQDPTAAVLVTEGELKAACASKQGFPTISVGGVYAWRSAKEGLELLPELDRVAWGDREVYLVFDADVTTKPSVQQALLHLSDTLACRGALVKLVTLPDLGDGATGLDDYLVAKGVGAFGELVAAAEDFGPAKALHELNAKVAYVRDPGLIVELKTGLRVTPAAFVQHTYANRFYERQVFDAKGRPKLQRLSLPKAWLEWEQRHELAGITYQPGDVLITSDRYYNLWRGWGCEPREGDVGPWTTLLAYIFKDDDVARWWFESWAAYQLQHPGTKLLTAVVLWGVWQGTGKSLVGYTLGRIFGDNFAEIQPSDLHDRYNEWAQGRQFVLGDEIAGGDKRADGELVKRMITRQQIRINTKYQPSFVIPDCINYLFTSNHPDPFYLEPSDRRFFVHEVKDAPLPLVFYQEYDRWYRGEGANYLFHHLLSLDLKEFDPNAPAPVTSAKQEMAQLAASDVDSWLLQLRAHPSETLKAAGGPGEADLWTAAQLRALYDPDERKRITTNGMARAMRRAGFRQVGGAQNLTSTSHGLVRLWAVQREGHWLGASLEQLREHFESHFGQASDARTEKF